MDFSILDVDSNRSESQAFSTQPMSTKFGNEDQMSDRLELTLQKRQFSSTKSKFFTQQMKEAKKGACLGYRSACSYSSPIVPMKKSSINKRLFKETIDTFTLQDENIIKHELEEEKESDYTLKTEEDKQSPILHDKSEDLPQISSQKEGGIRKRRDIKNKFKTLKFDQIYDSCSIEKKLYAENSDANLLQKIEKCRNQGVNTISADTMAQLINKKSFPYIVVDCRFDYEFLGGHIDGALNFCRKEEMEKHFFKSKETVENIMSTKSIIIFHCEFSQMRGPSMYKYMRQIDRDLHIHFYPQIFYNEIYLLEGGFKEFYYAHPQLCVGSYTPMKDEYFNNNILI